VNDINAQRILRRPDGRTRSSREGETLIGGTEMKRNSLKLLCVLVVGAFFVAAFAPVGLVGAGPGLEHNVWGTDAQYGADIGGATSIPAGSRITGWIDGVQYGINTTVAPDQSQFDLYVSGDDWGIEDDDRVKDGGYDGDLLQFWFDYDPSDYYLQISDFTVTFEEGGYHNESMFFDTQTYTDSQYPDTYLRGLKINEIVFDEWLYVYIYDPGDELNEAALEHPSRGYYIQTDNKTTHTIDGDIFDFSANTNDVIQNGPPGYYYINLSKTFNDFDNAEDDLRLVWKNPANWGGTPTADNIANGTDVVVDRVEWNNYDNQFETPQLGWRDYDNTTLLDAIGSPGVTQCFRRTTNGSDTDDCLVDCTITTKSPYAFPDEDLDTPGAPTNLRVHKGGGSFGGTDQDLVLTWDAPTWKYDKLKKNIVYYDSDLSDGFQFSTYEIKDSTFPGAGNEDSAILNGYLFDSFEYAFIVHTTGDTVGSFENMTNTNVGYKFNQVLDAPSGQSLVWVSIPYFSDYDMLSDIAHETDPDAEFSDNSIVTTVNKWNFSLQQYQKRQWLGFWLDDYDIEPGDAIQIQLNPSAPVYTWKIVGAHDDSLQFELKKNPSGTQFKMLSLPFHSTYQTASDISAEFPGGLTDGIDIIAKYNYTLQNWESWLWFLITGWTGDDFDIYPAPADVVMFQVTTTSAVYWQPQVIAI
jgi:hypothetical protein